MAQTASVHEKLANGTITRQAWMGAAMRAHAIWDRCGFPRVKAKYCNDMIVPMHLTPEFDRIHYHLLREM